MFSFFCRIKSTMSLMLQLVRLPPFLCVSNAKITWTDAEIVILKRVLPYKANCKLDTSLVFPAGGEMTALGADGEKDVSADQVSSYHMTRMPHVHAEKCKKRCFTLISQTLSELQAKEESKVAHKQAGMSTTASNMSAGSVKSGSFVWSYGISVKQREHSRSRTTLKMAIWVMMRGRMEPRRRR